MKEVFKNPYVIGGIVFIIGLIGVAWNIGSRSGGKLILQPDTSSVVRDTQSEVQQILPKDTFNGK